jgi:hypothetical protein
MPGKFVGRNNSYVTVTDAGLPKFVAWSAQLNLTYSSLTMTSNKTGFTYQAEEFVYGDDGIINSTMGVMLTDLDRYLSICRC